jgi:two-component system, sensor histidine kinase LadS
MINIKNLDVTGFSEEDCLKFLAEEKWAGGYVCTKCGHTNYCKGKTPYARRCTRCKHEESATANTIFHRCHIPITEAFRIVYMVCHDPSISTYEISRRIDLRQMTCWKLKSRLMECIEKRGEIDLLYKENRSKKNAEATGS